MVQELKSNSKPAINDTLMHCPEVTTMWLWIARSAFTDSFLLTLYNPIGVLQGLRGHWGALIRISEASSCCQWLS